jgi:putative sterol carrier protein
MNMWKSPVGMEYCSPAEIWSLKQRSTHRNKTNKLQMEIEQIKQELTENVKKIPALGKKLKFKLDDDFILIDGTTDENIVSSDDVDANCTITMSKETYGKLQRKEIKPMMATLTGKIKVKGDIGLAQKLKQLM